MAGTRAVAVRHCAAPGICSGWGTKAFSGVPVLLCAGEGWLLVGDVGWPP